MPTHCAVVDESEVEAALDGIMYGLAWWETIEGIDFWQDVYDRLGRYLLRLDGKDAPIASNKITYSKLALALEVEREFRHEPAEIRLFAIYIALAEGRKLSKSDKVAVIEDREQEEE